MPKVAFMKGNFEAKMIFLVFDTFYAFLGQLELRVLWSTSSTWKLCEWIIIWTKIIDTHNHIGAQSCPHRMKYWSKGIFSCIWALLWCIFRLIGVLRVELLASLTWKLWEWIIIWTKITNTHNHTSAKSCPRGINFEAKVIFFLFWTLFMHF